MKIGIIGSRTFDNYNFLEEQILKNFNIDDITLIVSGGANGADKLGENFAKNYKIRTLIFLPDWKSYGKSAGFKRNHDIINNSDIVIAFWNYESKGTENSIKLCEKKNKKCIIIDTSEL
jgi:hypothetical protein